MRGFLVAAPHSGSGKTTVTLGLLRALRDRDLRAVSAKAGPDYIDPAFHAAATGEDCVNLDPWAMRPALLRSLSWRFLGAGDIAVVEAMMGLFDGAADGTGSAADLAAALRLPVILVIDASRMAHSVAALVKGYRDHRPDVPFAGVILNRVGSPRHETMLRAALEEADIRVFGAVPGDSALSLPSRHLGLVQAGEHEALGDFIARAASMVGDNCDMDALMALATEPNEPRDAAELPPLGQRIAVARDEAFAFAYPHLLTGWQRQGAQLSFFSPLADEGPEPDADAVFLPGGYPELHAGRIAAAATCLDGLRMAANHGKPGLWGMRWLHGARRGSDRRRRRKTCHGGTVAGRNQLCAAQAPSRLPPAAAAWRLAMGPAAHRARVSLFVARIGRRGRAAFRGPRRARRRPWRGRASARLRLRVLYARNRQGGLMETIRHGGALDRAIATYGGERGAWLDLSTGINPVAYPIPELDAAIWQRLPDESQMEDCLQAAREYYGIPQEAGILAAPGTQAIIQWLPLLFNYLDRVSIVSPTYGEYAGVFRMTGVSVATPGGLPDEPDATDLLVVGQPNNPDGRDVAGGCDPALRLRPSRRHCR